MKNKDSVLPLGYYANFCKFVTLAKLYLSYIKV